VGETFINHDDALSLEGGATGGTGDYGYEWNEVEQDLDLSADLEYVTVLDGSRNLVLVAGTLDDDKIYVSQDFYFEVF